MYDIDKLTYEEIGDILKILNQILDLCSVNCIEDLKGEIKSILEYYGSDNLGYTIQKYDELGEVGNLLGCHCHDEIIEEIERLKEVNSKVEESKTTLNNKEEKAIGFLNEQDKMIDFFTTTKEQFLKFYSDVTEEEYETTKQDVLNRSGYWNSQYVDIEDGTTVGKILQSIMMIEWLKGKE